MRRRWGVRCYQRGQPSVLKPLLTSQDTSRAFLLRVSYLELYNEGLFEIIRDLLQAHLATFGIFAFVRILAQ